MVVIEVGYKKYIMSREKALLLAEVLESAELYEAKYWGEADRAAKGMTESFTHHVYPNEASFEMRIVSDSLYALAKLAGKPQEN
jgi:hypothetical protein